MTVALRSHVLRLYRNSVYCFIISSFRFALLIEIHENSQKKCEKEKIHFALKLMENLNWKLLQKLEENIRKMVSIVLLLIDESDVAEQTNWLIDCKTKRSNTSNRECTHTGTRNRTRTRTRNNKWQTMTTKKKNMKKKNKNQKMCLFGIRSKIFGDSWATGRGCSVNYFFKKKKARSDNVCLFEIKFLDILGVQWAVG